MIKVDFFGSDPIMGFHVTGHSGSARAGRDIICAGVSSAVYMAANTITDVLMLSPSLHASDGDVYLKLKTKDEAERSRVILDGLRLHLSQLALENPKYIKLNFSEV